MFEPSEDQASGLRQLFAPASSGGRPAPALLLLGCTRGDRIDRAITIDLAEALARAGRRPLLIELFDERRPEGEKPGPGKVPCIDGHELLGRDFDGKDLGELGRALQRRARGQGQAFETLLLAGDPLRLADLASGLTDRMLLLTPADAPSLARLYAQIKAIALAHGISRHAVLYRNPPEQARALDAHRRLASTAARFLHARLEFGGAVNSPASDPRSWDRLAAAMPGWARPFAEPVGASLN